MGNLIEAAALSYHLGLPQIRLDVISYRHRTYGRIEKPDFPIVGWTGGSKQTTGNGDGNKPLPRPSVKEELSDEIPF